MVEQSFQFIGTQFRIPQKIEDDARIEIAGARPHGDAAGWSQTHGGVDRYSIAQCAEARSVSQMRKDGSPWKVRAEVMHQGLVRNTVEAVAPNPGIEIGPGNRQSRCELRHGLVESVIETGEVSRRGEDRLRGRDQR